MLADRADATSVLTLELRDPQVNMAEGKRPELQRADQPLTRMAADAVDGRSGTDVLGYRDYRGVRLSATGPGCRNMTSVWRPKWLWQMPIALFTCFALLSGS